MATVPRYNKPVVEEGRLPNVKAPTDTPIEAFGGGRGLDRVVQAGRNLAQTGLDIYEAEKQKADQIAIRDADLSTVELTNEIEAGIKQLRGKEAGAAPDYVNKNWDIGAEKIASSLKTDNQRLAAQQILRARRARLDESTQIHMASEFKKYDDQQFESALELYRNEGSMKYNRPGAIANSIFQQENEIDQYAERNKLPPEWATSAKAKARSATIRDVLERAMIDDDKLGIGGDPTMTAKRYEKAVSKYLLPDDVAILERVRKENKIRQEDMLEQYERDVYLGLVDSDDPIPKKMDFLLGELRADRMKLSTYNKMENYVLSIYDDKTIPPDVRLAKYRQLIDKVNDLNGAKISKKTDRVKSLAKGNTMEELKPVMDDILASADHLTRGQQQKLMHVIQDNYNNPDPAWGFFQSLKNLFRKTPPVSPQKEADILDRGLDVLSEKIPTEQKGVKIQQLKDEVALTANPNMSKYPKGHVQKGSDGNYYQVVGHTNGNPNWFPYKGKEIKNSGDR